MGFRLPPPPPPFQIEQDAEQTNWLDERLDRPFEPPTNVGFTVPRGYEAYARILHPAQRILGSTVEQLVPLRWSEIADARGKTMHPEVALHALIDHGDTYDDNYWKAISVGDGVWGPAREGVLPVSEALALLSILRGATSKTEDAWFMHWEGTGNLGQWINDVPRGAIHRAAAADVPAELKGRVAAFRAYIVIRGPLDALSTWFEWQPWAGPHYWWPDDRAWIVVTEIDGFSTYVGGPKVAIDQVIASPFLEALPSDLSHSADGGIDPINSRP
jgi:hypothetical protein